MASLRIREKVERVMQFMLGLRHRRVSSMLMQHGFSQADLDEGWKLVRQAVGERLMATPIERPNPDALDELDAWENRWMPIVRATLQHRFPEIAKEVFLNLSRTHGPEVALSVSMLIERVTKLEEGGQRHQAARMLLTERGLSRETINKAKALIAQLSTVQPLSAAEQRAAASREAQRVAAGKLWAWYVEWSAIAQAAIHDGRLLRLLGYRGRPGRKPAATKDEVLVDDFHDGLPM